MICQSLFNLFIHFQWSHRIFRTGIVPGRVLAHPSHQNHSVSRYVSHSIPGRSCPPALRMWLLSGSADTAAGFSFQVIIRVYCGYRKSSQVSSLYCRQYILWGSRSFTGYIWKITLLYFFTNFSVPTKIIGKIYFKSLTHLTSSA